ncbi:hypothetical protein GGR50DRAFT_635266 [Xylaria sp. CBS 124048]|nr:hypothetical protein GGR50DRAFT_635266 [Xylaria sp. CBS 124048]
MAWETSGLSPSLSLSPLFSLLSRWIWAFMGYDPSTTETPRKKPPQKNQTPHRNLFFFFFCKGSKGGRPDRPRMGGFGCDDARLFFSGFAPPIPHPLTPFISKKKNNPLAVLRACDIVTLWNDPSKSKKGEERGESSQWTETFRFDKE